MDDEAGVDPEDRAADLRHVVGVGVAAEPGIGFEEGHGVLPVQDVRGGQSRHAAANHGYSPALGNPCCI